MSFFGNLFGSKLQEININDLDLKSTDTLATRATNMLVGAGLRGHSDFLTLIDNVVAVMRRYQEVDVEASAANIKKVLIETPAKEAKKESKPNKPKAKNTKKVETVVTPLTDATVTITPAKTVKKSSKKSVYNRKSVKQKTVD